MCDDCVHVVMDGRRQHVMTVAMLRIKEGIWSSLMHREALTVNMRSNLDQFLAPRGEESVAPIVREMLHLLCVETFMCLCAR